MPLYDYICHKCGNRVNDVYVFSSSAVIVCECGSEMEKDFSSMRVMMVGDIEPYYNESLGVVIKSRRHLRQVLWETNSRTDDISPVGGLTPEERAIRRGEKLYDRRSIFEKRKDSNWAMVPDSDGVITDGGVDIDG